VLLEGFLVENGAFGAGEAGPELLGARHVRMLVDQDAEAEALAFHAQEVQPGRYT